MVQRRYQSPFHCQHSYSHAECSCNDSDMCISCTCLYRKLVLVSNPVFFAPLRHSHSLNASRHTKLLELQTISASSATTYFFDSLLPKFHLATQKLGSMWLCLTAVNPSSWLHNCEPKPPSPLHRGPAAAVAPRTPDFTVLLVVFPLLPLHLAPPPTVQTNIHILNLPVFAGANCSLRADPQLRCIK